MRPPSTAALVALLAKQSSSLRRSTSPPFKRRKEKIHQRYPIPIKLHFRDVYPIHPNLIPQNLSATVIIYISSVCFPSLLQLRIHSCMTIITFFPFTFVLCVPIGFPKSTTPPAYLPSLCAFGSLSFSFHQSSRHLSLEPLFS